MSEQEIEELKASLEDALRRIQKIGVWISTADKAVKNATAFRDEQKKINNNLYECLSGVSKKADAIAEAQAKARAKTEAKAAPKPEARTSAHEFFRLRLISDPTNVVAKCDIYAIYHQWCRDRGISHVDKVAFGMAILSSVPGCRVTRLSRDGDRLQAYRGVRLLPQDTVPSEEVTLPPRLSNEEIVAEFVQDRCKQSLSAVIKKSKVLAAFETWRAEYGHPHVPPKEFYRYFPQKATYATEVLTGKSDWKSHNYRNIVIKPNAAV